MTEEEYIRNRLDMINQNSHYGIPVDTEITKMVREHLKRLEDNEMNATSVQKIENVRNISFIMIENDHVEEKYKMSIVASTNDDIFEFDFEGPELIQQCKAAGLFTGWEKDQKIRELEKKLSEWKKEAAECLVLRDEAQKEAYKLKKENEKLKKELDLEKAANGAQYKFIKEYAGKDTEVTFNYAIGSGPITYGLYDKDYVDELRKKNNNLIAENAELKSKLCYKAKSADDVKKLKGQIKKDEEPSSRRDILRCAEKCVCGHREQDYGSPESNFQLIADLLNAYFGNVPRQEIKDFENKIGITHKYDAKLPWEITPLDVSMIMAIVKIARIKNGGGSGDSFVDLAGYAACGGEIWAGNKKS